MTVVCVCGKKLQVPDALAGHEVICPFCRAAVKAPVPAPAPDDPTLSLIQALKNQPSAAPAQDEHVADLAATIQRAAQENQPLPMVESAPAAAKKENLPLPMAEPLPATQENQSLPMAKPLPATRKNQPLPMAESLPPKGRSVPAAARPASKAARPAPKPARFVPKPARPKPKTAQPVPDEPKKGLPFYYYIIGGVLAALIVAAIILIARSGDEEKPVEVKIAAPPPVTHEAPKPAAVTDNAGSDNTFHPLFGDTPGGDSKDYEKRTGKKADNLK
jgi:hypothetical protein